MSDPRAPAWRLETRLAHPPAPSSAEAKVVNPAIQRGSTVLFDRAADLYGDRVKSYGLDGLAAHDALTAALTEISGAHATLLAPSGLAACAIPLLTCCEAGAEVLVTDSVYGPTRRLCNEVLARFGVRTRYYDPRIGAGIEALLSDATRLIFLESPGSLTFEVQDVPAIAKIAAARGVATAIDDTWSAGVLFRPFDHGVDYSIQALTKYQAGHSDVLLGAVCARTADHARRAYQTIKALGYGAGSAEDAYLTLRGMRTMALRMERQDTSARHVARWLEGRPEVAEVLHPALPSHPDHGLWARDFTGAGGLFGVVLHPDFRGREAAFLEGLRLFAMGFSWGGFESLAIPCDPQLQRTATPWTGKGPLLRLSIGLEAPEDLIGDLESGFERLHG